MASEFKPTEELLKLQAIELDIFKRFRDLCNKHGLQYYADAGTLLGAVRHGGFIPWDDDMDVVMKWDDYLKFRKIAVQELEYPYFFMDYSNNDYAEVTCAQLKRSDTTLVTEWEYTNIKTPDYNRGVFIDIFPMFAVPDGEQARAEQKSRIVEAWRAIRGWNAAQNLEAGYPTKYAEYLPDYEKVRDRYTIRQIKQMYMDACAMAEGTDTRDLGLTSFRTHDKRYTRNRNLYDESVELPFEDTTIICPKHYEEVLTINYGDWKTPVYNGAVHTTHIFDTKTPYLERNDLY